jgi:hypothetical protein
MHMLVMTSLSEAQRTRVYVLVHMLVPQAHKEHVRWAAC